MEYKQGDVVIITAQRGYYDASNGLAHLEEMDEFTGAVCVITDVDPDGDLELALDGEETGFWWSEEWVEPFFKSEEDSDLEVDMSDVL